MPSPTIEKRIRWAGCLIGLGVAVQLASLLWSHPLAFMTFIGVGAPLTVAGVLLYLYALAAGEAAERSRGARAR